MLFVPDSANLDEIREMADWGELGGITTNPSLVVKEHQDLKKLVKEACKTVFKMLVHYPLTDSGLEHSWQIGKLPKRESA